jgi:Pyruvate/2-oxoacid:ferredoxin oxidoreductase delta subunit
MWYCVTGSVFSEMFKECRVFTPPWRWRHVPFKSQDALTLEHDITSQKTCGNLKSRIPCLFMIYVVVLLVAPLHSAFKKLLCTYKRCWKWCPWVSIQAWTHLILFAKTFCRSAFRKLLCTCKRCWKWCPRASIQAWTKPTYRSLSAQRLSECTVYWRRGMITE